MANALSLTPSQVDQQEQSNALPIFAHNLSITGSLAEFYEALNPSEYRLPFRVELSEPHIAALIDRMQEKSRHWQPFASPV
jgi:hypothetical protein